MSKHEEAPKSEASSSQTCYANPQAEVVCKTCGWFGLFTDVVLERGLEDNDEVCPECGSNNLEDLVDAEQLLGGTLPPITTRSAKGGRVPHKYPSETVAASGGVWGWGVSGQRAEYNPEWKPDCQGKWDYDCDLVSLSCRYWPQGGGFNVLDTSKGTWEGNDARPEIRPSAMASICIGDLAAGPYEEMASAEFEGDTEAEVKAKVEAWAKETIARVDAAIRREFQRGGE